MALFSGAAANNTNRFSNPGILVALLLDPYTLKSVTLRNRIGVSPMCQYSCEDGYATDWHLVHLGSRAVGGAGLVIAEATAVSPEGRISPACSGIYHEDHTNVWERINHFLKQHGAVPGIQLAHAGRKGSASRPWDGDAHLDIEQGGWQTIAPSAIAFGGALSKVPTAMTTEDIARVQRDFVVAAERSLAAGFEWLELHFAHGYLAHEFYSPLSNHRTDAYGGSFQNRTRFLRETFAAVRKVWPERLPLTVRLSVTDWQPGGVTVEESIELVQWLQAEGLDLLDVSHGFVTPDISVIPWAPGFMAPIAAALRRATQIPIAVGWMITEPKQAEDILQQDGADLILLARELLRDPYWPYHAALALEDSRAESMLPVQYARAVKKR